MNITIVDYYSGNVASVTNSFKKVGNELDDDIKEGRLSYMDKEHIAELIDFVREDAEDIVIEK